MYINSNNYYFTILAVCSKCIAPKTAVCHITFLPTIFQQQLDINHIFYKCNLTEPQAKGVLKALQLVKPYYSPKVPESSDEVKYPALVKSWYLERGNVHPELNSVPGCLVNELDEAKLKELFEQQISKELSGFTPILSIESEKDISGENEKSKALFLECRDTWRKALIESIEKELIEIKNSKGTVLLPFFILILLQVRAWQNNEVCHKVTVFRGLLDLWLNFFILAGVLFLSKPPSFSYVNDAVRKLINSNLY